MKFYSHLGSRAAETPVKFHSDTIIVTPNLATSRLREVSRHDVRLLGKKKPWIRIVSSVWLYFETRFTMATNLTVTIANLKLISTYLLTQKVRFLWDWGT